MLTTELPLPCGAALPNRIAKSATSEALADRISGTPDERLVNVYERWGRGGAGLLVTGNVAVASEGRTEPGNVVVTDERDLEPLSKWAEAAQRHGAKLWMQVNHAGRQAPRKITRRPVAPSPVGMKGLAGLFARPRPLTDEEIRDLVERYATAARVAKKAGFSGVQIHAAHGYLVSQFLSPLTNLREDDWGGTPQKRMRFLVEIVRAMRREVGHAFPIGVKLNSADFQRGGFTEEESMAVVEQLEREGIDLLEISGGSYEKSAMMGSESTRKREAYFLDYAAKVRGLTKLPLMLTGGLRTAQGMRSVVADGHVDVVGMARPLVVEPDLPSRVLTDPEAAALDVTPRVGLKLLDNMLQVVWYQAQLRRMAAGEDPDPRLGSWGPLFVGFAHNYAFNPFSPAKAA